MCDALGAKYLHVSMIQECLSKILEKSVSHYIYNVEVNVLTFQPLGIW
jgi:hypothetical protein